jgi:hypothetical protein
MYMGLMLGRQVYTTEPLVPELSAFEFEMATEKLKRHKSPSSDQIPAELIKAWGRTIHCEIHKLLNSIRHKEELPEKWKVSNLPIYSRDDENKTTVIIQAYNFCHYVQNVIIHPVVIVNSICRGNFIVPVYRRDEKTDCSNYRGKSLLSTMYKMLHNILLSLLTPYAEEIIADHQGGFLCNRLLLTIYSAFVKYLRKMGIQ